MRRATLIAGAAVVGIAAFVGATASPLLSNIETPKYLVERADGPIEIRSYPSMIVATTTVEGSRGSAVNAGFRILAGYIFGANEGSEKIAMTAPVMQNRQLAADGPDDERGTWSVRFVMPSDKTIESLPAPRDHRVTLEKTPPGSFAAIQFSGFWRNALLRQKTDELSDYITRHRLSARGGPVYAFYNPPWTLPFFRRNEVMIEVAPVSR